MEKSIVCGVDGSADSAAALAVAARLADRLERRLVLANVVEPVGLPYATVGAFGSGLAPGAPAAVLDEQLQVGERLLEEMVEEGNVQTGERRVVTGFAAERLAEVADEEDAALIVVGSRGRGAFKAAFLGSVSTSLIGVARCPVLVVPPGAGET
jgi:nucleotide-binding universal stress UspA family protein